MNLIQIHDNCTINTKSHIEPRLYQTVCILLFIQIKLNEFKARFEVDNADMQKQQAFRGKTGFYNTRNPDNCNFLDLVYLLFFSSL